ncbi:hypothetical protein [Algoriphagus antarcticus]|uniref:Uncharacterized protein n=1 Tax=Algoriphagus antarcticus TaxID=238540 RepID=A0A3E0D5X5_9BACT|nr:hypothetical protein [Algoriphagus antarcticus]REG77505.1 hypothetical protein C8N25_1435 [Algoriphagus antarcticus]
MKQKKKLEGANKFGIKIQRNTTLNSSSKKVLFPAKLEFANKVISKLKLETN